MKIIADHIQAEPVDRRDLGPGKKRFLPLQPFVSRVLQDPLRQSLPDPFPHLGRGRFGKRGDQQTVRVHRMFRIRDQGQDPLHQHRRLAGTRGGRHQQIFFSGVDDLFLVLCPYDAHPCSSFIFSQTSSRSMGCRRRFSHPSSFRSKPQTL